MKEEESTSVVEIEPTTSPKRFSVIDRSSNVIALGASLTAVTTKEKVAESEPPCPSVTLRTKVPMVSDVPDTSSLGVKVSTSN